MRYSLPKGQMNDGTETKKQQFIGDFISLTRFDLTDVNIEYQLRLSTQYRAIGAFYIPTPLVADFEDFKIKLHSSLKTSVDYGSTHVLERNSFQWLYLTFTIH